MIVKCTHCLDREKAICKNEMHGDEPFDAGYCGYCGAFLCIPCLDEHMDAIHGPVSRGE